jgi:phosphotriesterase-related protein
MLRRVFLGSAAAACAAPADAPRRTQIQTVRGPVAPKNLGVTLMHEHVLVDFVGADKVSPSRYNVDEVFRVALPKLEELKKYGCQTLVECTPAYIGRDVKLLRRLSEASGLHLITNTGFYGAADDKFVPKRAEEIPAEEIAQIWIREYREGIEGTGIRPGFMKIGVDSGALSKIDAKLVEAGCICHKATGLRMHIHTGNGPAAMDILNVLAKQGVPASAFVWVHAQSEKDRKVHAEAAKAGAWIEYDGVSAARLKDDLSAVTEMIGLGYLNRLLLSHDSGWYRVGEPGGGRFNGYTYIFEEFLPALRKRGITEAQERTLMADNPARALTWQ